MVGRGHIRRIDERRVKMEVEVVTRVYAFEYTQEMHLEVYYTEKH